MPATTGAHKLYQWTLSRVSRLPRPQEGVEGERAVAQADVAVARTDHELRLLEALVDCAHGLSVGVAEAAKVERDRDYEPVSLPKFLSTLGVMASDAARLPGLPARVHTELLPTLDTLLARAKGSSAPSPAPATHAVALLTRPKTTPKSALLSATSAISAQPLAFHGQPRPPPYRST